MTDEQKPIIIDGVDVSGCKFYISNNGVEAQGYYELVDLCRCNDEKEFCYKNSNCYYKQLKRKEQECEEFRKANAEKNEFLQKLGISTTGEFHRINHYVDKLKQECEELKEEVSYGDNQNIRWCRAWLKMWRQRNLYKQALEKIEEYTKTTLTMPLERKVILTIINEVKNND